MTIQQYYLFPGSFKPPHIGHYSIVLRTFQLLEIQNKLDSSHLVIFISSKPRTLPISQYPLDAKLSLALWKIWIECLPKIYQDKITVKIAYFASPIMDAVSFAKQKSKYHPHMHFYFIKSKKDVENDRFKGILQQSPTYHELEFEVTENISSRDVRQKLEELVPFNWFVFRSRFAKEFPQKRKVFYDILDQWSKGRKKWSM